MYVYWLPVEPHGDAEITVFSSEPGAFEWTWCVKSFHKLVAAELGFCRMEWMQGDAPLSLCCCSSLPPCVCKWTLYHNSLPGRHLRHLCVKPPQATPPRSANSCRCLWWPPATSFPFCFIVAITFSCTAQLDNTNQKEVLKENGTYLSIKWIFIH